MRKFKKKLNASNQSLVELMEQTLQSRPEDYIFNNLSVFNAIFEYAVDIKVFWAICIFVDIIPLLAFIFILIAGPQFIIANFNYDEYMNPTVEKR